jgi:hypothetical protein
MKQVISYLYFDPISKISHDYVNIPKSETLLNPHISDKGYPTYSWSEVQGKIIGWKIDIYDKSVGLVSLSKE